MSEMSTPNPKAEVAITYLNFESDSKKEDKSCSLLSAVKTRQNIFTSKMCDIESERAIYFGGLGM